jgi:hypothetical protein
VDQQATQSRLSTTASLLVWEALALDHLVPMEVVVEQLFLLVSIQL